MSFWDDVEPIIVRAGKRRDTSKVGVARSVNEGYPGRMYIPGTMAKPGQFVRFVETPEGLAFKIGDTGDYRIYIQNGGAKILLCMLPPCMNKYAPLKAMSVDIEDFEGGYLIRYSQFQK